MLNQEEVRGDTFFDTQKFSYSQYVASGRGDGTSAHGGKRGSYVPDNHSLSISGTNVAARTAAGGGPASTSLRSQSIDVTMEK